MLRSLKQLRLLKMVALFQQLLLVTLQVLRFCRKVIVEINTSLSESFEGLHDIYIPTYRPTRTPIPLTKVDERIGTTAIQIDPSKIVGIVFNDTHDSPSTVTPPDDETQGIANHLIAFFEKEVAEGRLPKNLGPLQAGIGSIANAVLTGLKDSNFEDLIMYSEVLQDCTFELIDAGKMKFASGSSITLSAKCGEKVLVISKLTKTN